MFLAARIFLIAVSLGVLASSVAMAQSAQSWEQILAAAKKEGTVSVIGPQGSETRDALTLAFQKKYPDIRVELQSMAGNQIGPKLFNELAAGRNSTDLLITGTTTALETLLPAKALVAVKPWLAGPNTQDPSKWRGGKLTFSDEAQSYNLVFSAYVKAPFIYNSQLVSRRYFHDLEISSRNQLRVVNERRLDVGAENQIVTLRFIGKRQLPAAPLARILGVRSGKPWFDGNQRFCRQQSFQRRGRPGNQQVGAVAAGGKLIEQFGADLITGHALQLDSDIRIFFLKGQSQCVARLASLRSDDRNRAFLLGGG